jgi:hypothetical protein
MRYIDTGTRDPAQALGSWLAENVQADPSLVQLRWQTGFFTPDSLGYFVPALARLREFDGVLEVLVGSNDGRTQRAGVEALLAVAGPARANQRIGIVSFENGYFHPKTVHIVRRDGSTGAYVGSANLTGSGVAALHVEAGILLDTREGDEATVISQVAAAIDWWFAEQRQGLTVVTEPADLDALVASGVLNVPPPPPPPRPRAPAASGTGPRLTPLLGLPELPPGIVVAPPPAPAPPGPIVIPPPPVAALPAARWAKRLTRSDAQRKTTGNQRGSITLVRARYPINPQTYFRRDFFQAANWASDETRTGETRETALVPFEVDLLGRNLGILHIPVTYASNREAAQANYTSLLHLSPLAPHFARRDMTGKWLVLDRRTDGRFSLAILDQAP